MPAPSKARRAARTVAQLEGPVVQQPLQQPLLRLAGEQLVLVHDLLRPLPELHRVHAEAVRQVPLARLHLAVLRVSPAGRPTIARRTLSSTITANTAILPSRISSTRRTSSRSAPSDARTAGARERSSAAQGTAGARKTMRTRQSSGRTNSPDSSSLRRSPRESLQPRLEVAPVGQREEEELLRAREEEAQPRVQPAARGDLGISHLPNSKE